MAFFSMLCRASASVVPLAVRAVRSQRTFHRSISTLPCVRKSSLVPEITRRSFVLRSQFSTATAEKENADESLIRVIKSEIECAEEPIEGDLPDGFPFEIQDNAGERTILLTRQFHDEIIKVEVDMPSQDADTEHDDNDDDQESQDGPSVIPLVVSISKGSGPTLEFGITAFPDEISIDSLSVKNPPSSEDQLAYEGPDFNDLDENLQKSFHKYLEIRGIKPSITSFLLEYMVNKDNKEYLQWLSNIKSFIEK